MKNFLVKDHLGNETLFENEQAAFEFARRIGGEFYELIEGEWVLISQE